ncbi:hypothetical protein [Dyella sp. 20L07]|uniref:hypothetical protein n=1 Tax=Dyella sp. 20L07 TaxID=3384240 RepID=UPI003D274551
MRSLIATMLFLLASMAWAQSLDLPTTRLYAVVFEVTVNSAGKVDTLSVSKVIDPSSGATNAVAMVVPQSYVVAARAFLSKRTYPSDPKQFFTYTFYDPSQPARADIDPKAERQQ